MKKLVFLFLMTVITLMSFKIKYSEDPAKIAHFLNKLANEKGKKGGCKYPREALTILKTYQLIREKYPNSDISDKSGKVSTIRASLKQKCEFDLPPKIMSTYTSIEGSVSVESKIQPYILAIEMMTKNQQKVFLETLPDEAKIQYSSWKSKNNELQKKLKEHLFLKEVVPVDVKDINYLVNRAIKSNNQIKLQDYNIKETQFQKLLKDKKLIQEVQKQNKLNHIKGNR